MIGRRSSYIVLAIVYDWQTKDQRPQRTNVNAKNLEQNTQYLRNKLFSRKSVWVLLELVGRWTQHFTKIDQRTCKIGQICIWNPWLPDLLCKHWFASLVWNFCRWVADILPREMFPAVKSEEKRMFSQANIFIETETSGYEARDGRSSPPESFLTFLIPLSPS